MLEGRDEVVVTQTDSTPRWVGLAVVVLAAVSLVALGVGWSATTHTKSLEQALGSQTQTLKQSQDVLGQRLAQAEENNAQVAGELNVVTDRLKLTQGELRNAKKYAKQIKEDDAKKLADVESSVNTQLATKASSDDVNKLGGDVNGVKTDLESTKQNLQMAKGEFGTLIAKNHDDIEQLRRLGQRDYYEFTIAKKGERQKVGDLMVELRGTNQKKNLYSVAIYVDDLRYEKRNRSANEPIYFYTRGSRAPMELVINQVGKDKVVGYLSVPKVKEQQQGTGN
jgi:prefoldin subunit 5